MVKLSEHLDVLYSIYLHTSTDCICLPVGSKVFNKFIFSDIKNLYMLQDNRQWKENNTLKRIKHYHMYISWEFTDFFIKNSFIEKPENLLTNNNINTILDKNLISIISLTNQTKIFLTDTSEKALYINTVKVSNYNFIDLLSKPFSNIFYKYQYLNDTIFFIDNLPNVDYTEINKFNLSLNSKNEITDSDLNLENSKLILDTLKNSIKINLEKIINIDNKIIKAYDYKKNSILVENINKNVR